MSRKLTQGEQNFSRCANKKLFTGPKTKTQNGTDVYSTILRCAVTGPEGFSAYTRARDRSLQRLAKDAGEKLCGSCVFADMSQTTYQQYCAEAADAEAVRIKAEHGVALLRMQLNREYQAAVGQAVAEGAAELLAAPETPPALPANGPNAQQ